LRLDGDEDISYPVKFKSKLIGYPTTIFLTADGEEIARMVGYSNQKKYLKLVREAWSNRTRPFVSLKAQADQGNTEAAAELGSAYLDQTEYELAAPYLEKGGKASAEKLADARIGIAEKNSPTELASILEKAIHDFPDTVDSIYRRTKLASVYETEGKKDLQKKVTEEAFAVAKKILSEHPEIVDSHADAGDFLGTVAESFQSLGDEKHALEGWKLAAKELEKDYSKHQDPGNGLDLGFMLTEAGDTQGAEKIYKHLQSKFPDDFVFYLAYGRLKYKQKDYARAKALGNQALKLSYGENRFKVVKLMVQVLKATGEKKEALDLIEKTKQTLDLPEKPTAGTKRVLETLDKMKKELSA
jgi:tetratricopeptide (TPR) repeat protein